MSIAHRTKLLLVAMSFLAVLLLLASCSQRATDGKKDSEKASDRSAAATADDVEGHGLHVLKNNRLREIMQRLSAMDFEAISREIDAFGKVNRDICEVSRMAEELSLDAQVIPLIFKRDAMQDESRRVVDTMSRRLYEQAVELRHYADSNDVRMVKVKIDEMISTCNSCHVSFRAPALAAAGGSEVLLLGDAGE
ncbi:MAG: cytochrome c [Planctomycetes bacterium]|nr:cytochrome c [Planctomycetota bacterium]